MTAFVCSGIFGLTACGDTGSQGTSVRPYDIAEPTNNATVTEPTNVPEVIESSAKTEMETTEETLNEAHVEQIMQWIDKSMVKSANIAASVLYRGTGETLYESDNEIKMKCNGTYSSQLPEELAGAVESYFPEIQELNNYCIQIENGEVKGCWCELPMPTKEEILGLTGDYEDSELWNDMGFTDYAALDEGIARLDSSCYGSFPKRTCSVYNEITEDNSGYSNVQPDIRNCAK